MSKLLALNMIVGGGEQVELERCLNSVVPSGLFDEIIIVLTTKDEKVKEVAEKFTDKIFYHPWTSRRYPHGSFALARNAALRETESEFVMWLDADDIVKTIGDPLQIATNLRNYIQGCPYDFFTMEYKLTFDKNDNCQTKILRERIFKRKPEIFWSFPVHEQLTLDPKVNSSAIINGVTVEHRPLTPPDSSIGRNEKILKYELTHYPSFHLQFWLAKELYGSGRKKLAVPILEEIVDAQIGTTDTMSTACVYIANYYLNCIDEPDIDKAETYCRISFGFNNCYDEPLVFLGDIYKKRKNERKAAEFYRKALQKEFNGLGVQSIEFYKKIPSLRLMELCHSQGKLEAALNYSRLVLDCDATDKRILELRRNILEKLTEQNTGVLTELSVKT